MEHLEMFTKERVQLWLRTRRPVLMVRLHVPAS